MNRKTNQSKTKTTQLNENNVKAISVALEAYANSAFPPGGSECSQASNQSLKEIAKKIESALQHQVTIKKCQLPMLKAALRWYYKPEESGIDAENLINELLKLSAQSRKNTKKI